MGRKRVILSSTVMTPLILLLLLFQSSIGRYDSYGTSSNIEEDEYDEEDNVYGSKSTSTIGLERLLFPISLQYTRLIESIALDKRFPISSECSKSLLLIAEGIRQRKPFAFRFLDASAKNPSGILEGQTTDLGNYDECLDIHHTKEDLNGKYCMVHIHSKSMDRKLNAFRNRGKEESSVDHDDDDIDVSKSKMNPLERLISSGMESNYVSSLNYGLCIPSKCSSNDIEISLKKQFRDLNWRLRIDPDCDEKGGNSNGEIDFISLGSISIILILVTLVTVATWCDLNPDVSQYTNTTNVDEYPRLEHETDNKADRRGSANKSQNVWRSNSILSNMSIVRNSGKLFSDYEDTVNKTLSFVHGARVWFTLALTWINLWVYNSVFIPTSTGPFKASTSKNVSDVISTSTVGFNDMMFTMSGILVVYTWLPQLERSSRTNFPSRKATFVRYFITRWLRTTPTVLAALLLSFGLSALGSGPLFNTGSKTLSGNCVKNWWAALLQVSNWIEPSETCLPFNWYLSVDFQLYILAFFMLWFIAVKPTAGIFTSFLLVVVGLIAPGISSYVFEIDSFNPIPGMPFQELGGHFSSINYLSSYFCGILVGYCLLKAKKPVNEGSWIGGWIATLSFFALINSTSPAVYTYLISFFSSQGETHSSLEPSSPFLLFTEEIVFFSLKKLSTLLLVSWTCYTLANSRARFLDPLLSSKFFTPLSRMAFSIYSSQFAIVAIDSLVRRSSYTLTIYEAVTRTISVWILSIILGFLIYMVFEAPSVNLIKSALLKLSPNELVTGRMPRGLKGQRRGAKQQLQSFNNNNNTKGMLILQNKYK